MLRQLKDPEYYIRRDLPATARPYRPDLHGEVIVTNAAAE